MNAEKIRKPHPSSYQIEVFIYFVEVYLKYG